MHQNEWFQVWFFKNFLGSPLPRPLPPLFSRASPSVRALPSILGRFAPLTRASPSILGHFAPSIRASPSTFDWGPWFGPPQNKFLDPPLVARWFYCPETPPHCPSMSHLHKDGRSQTPQLCSPTQPPDPCNINPQTLLTICSAIPATFAPTQLHPHP